MTRDEILTFYYNESNLKKITNQKIEIYLDIKKHNINLEDIGYLIAYGKFNILIAPKSELPENCLVLVPMYNWCHDRIEIDRMKQAVWKQVEKYGDDKNYPKFFEVILLSTLFYLNQRLDLEYD